jgi:hypothetical protein
MKIRHVFVTVNSILWEVFIGSECILHQLTSATFVGTFHGSLYCSLKKESLAEVIVVRIPAMMVLVFIATDMDEEASPITKTGDSRGSLKTDQHTYKHWKLQKQPENIVTYIQTLETPEEIW